MAKSSKKKSPDRFARAGRVRKKIARARRPETRMQKADHEREAEDAGKLHMISATSLTNAVKAINSILEHNSEQAGSIAQIKRAAQEKGMDGVALGLLVRLYRKGQNNAVKLRQILDSFDYGRGVLKLDDLKAADMLLDEAVGMPRSGEEAAQIDPNQTNLADAVQAAWDAAELAKSDDASQGENVYSIEAQRRLEAS